MESGFVPVSTFAIRARVVRSTMDAVFSAPLLAKPRPRSLATAKP
jgi:hypothetical protein